MTEQRNGRQTKDTPTSSPSRTSLRVLIVSTVMVVGLLTALFFLFSAGLPTTGV